MFRILDSRSTIETAHQRFAAAIQALSTETVSGSIGYPGGAHRNASVMWLSSLGIWAHLGFPKMNRSRYWDVFGIGKPTPRVAIVCEINSPLEGINRNIAGAFGVSDKDELALFHRGRLHGAGLNKEFFCANYRGTCVPVMDGNCQAKLILVAVVDSADFGIALKRFVLEVDRIKSLARNKV